MEHKCLFSLPLGKYHLYTPMNLTILDTSPEWNCAVLVLPLTGSCVFSLVYSCFEGAHLLVVSLSNLYGELFLSIIGLNMASLYHYI